MDIYDALSNGELFTSVKNCAENNTGYRTICGHGTQYYNSGFSEKRTKEIWANYLSLKAASPELADLLKKEKPSLCDYLDKKIKQAVEKLENE